MKKSDEPKNLSSENKSLIDNFLNSLIVSGCSENTISAYRSDLRQFQTLNNFCSITENIDEQFNNFVFNYKTKKSQISPENLSYRSITRKVTAIRSFYNYLIVTRQLKEKPSFMTTFKTQRLKRQSPKILSKDEIELLIQSCNSNAEKFQNKRLFWMMMESLIECLYSSGMRISECLAITINQIFDNQGKILNELNVVGKGGKVRIIFLNHKAQESMLRFLKKRFHRESKEANFMLIKNLKEYLFSAPHSAVNKLSSKILHSQTSRMKVYFTLKKLARMNDINPTKVSPHTFRHSIAVHLLLSKNNDKQNNIALIKSFLGHSSIDTTKVYLGYEDVDNLRNIMNKSHPLAKLK